MSLQHRQWIDRARVAANDYDVGLAGVVVMALAMQLLYITKKPLMVDESISLWYVDHYPAPELWHVIPETQPHLPLYYVLLDDWVAVVGHNFALVRLLGIPFALLTVVAGYGLAEQLHDRETALWTAAVLAFCPMIARQATEIRPYAMLTGLGAAATYLVVRALDTGDYRDRWLAAGPTLALAWTHPFGLLTVGILGDIVLWRGDLWDWRWPGAVVAGGSAAPAGWALLRVMPGHDYGAQSGQLSQVTHVPHVTPEWLGLTVSRFVAGRVLTLTDLAVVGLFVTCVAAGAITVRRQEWGAIPILAVGAPWGVAILVSMAAKPILGPKYVLATAAPAALLAARGGLRLGSLVGVRYLVVGVLVVGLALSYPPGASQRWDWTGAAAHVDDMADDETVAVVDIYHIRGPLPYLADTPTTPTGAPSTRSLADVTGQTGSILLVTPGDRITARQRRTLTTAGYQQTARRYADGIHIYRFERGQP